MKSLSSTAAWTLDLEPDLPDFFDSVILAGVAALGTFSLATFDSTDLLTWLTWLGTPP